VKGGNFQRRNIVLPSKRGGDGDLRLVRSGRTVNAGSCQILAIRGGGNQIQRLY